MDVAFCCIYCCRLYVEEDKLPLPDDCIEDCPRYDTPASRASNPNSKESDNE